MFHPVPPQLMLRENEVQTYVGDVRREPKQKEQIRLYVHKGLDGLRRAPAAGRSESYPGKHATTYCRLSGPFWSPRLRLTITRRSARVNQCVWYGESGMKINMKTAQAQHRAPMIRNSYFQLGRPAKLVRNARICRPQERKPLIYTADVEMSTLAVINLGKN